MEYWEDLSIIARIRRWKQACQTPDSQAVDPVTIAEDLVESRALRAKVLDYEIGVLPNSAGVVC